jgi:hypothetical protein
VVAGTAPPHADNADASYRRDSITAKFTFVVMMGSLLKRAFVVTVIAAAAGLYGCASSYVEPTDSDTASACEITAAAASAAECNSADLERQARDAADYKDEPALGYLNSPPGLLPIPVTARNPSPN